MCNQLRSYIDKIKSLDNARYHNYNREKLEETSALITRCLLLLQLMCEN